MPGCFELYFYAYLGSEPETPPFCAPYTVSSNNSNMPQQVLLLGSANLDAFNGYYSSSVAKYKDLITLLNNPQLSYLPVSKIFYTTSLDSNANYYSLESYYSGLSNQYFNDTLFSRKTANISTATDVEQPSYEEAIVEYQAIINNPINETERHYAYIDQMRTVRLMLDSLLNGLGDNPTGSNYSFYELKTLVEGILNHKFSSYNIKSDTKLVKYEVENNSVGNVDTERPVKKVQLDKQNNNNFSKSKLNNSTELKNQSSIGFNPQLLSIVSTNDKNVQLSNLRNSLNLENLMLNGISNTEKVILLDKIIGYKLFEYALLANSINARPLNRMNAFKKSKSTIESTIPIVFKLYQNYPNPFNPVSTIKYDLPKQSLVTIKIFDIIGREVATLVNETKEPGYYSVSFDGTNYSSGVYFYRIDARQVGSLSGIFSSVKKMVLLK